MRKFLVSIALTGVLISCIDQSVYSHKKARAVIDLSWSDIEKVEGLLKALAANWNLNFYEKDRNQMSFLSAGEEAFFIALFHHDESILFLEYAGDNESLELAVVDFGTMPLSELEKLFEDVQLTLKSEFEIEFQEVAVRHKN